MLHGRILFVYLSLLFCCYSCFVALCVFIFVCTSVELLPPGESPIAVSNNNNNNNNKPGSTLGKMT